MKQVGAYPFRVWKREALKHLSPILPRTEADYPTVDFYRIYKTLPDPERAAEIIKAVHIFTKDKYKAHPSPAVQSREE